MCSPKNIVLNHDVVLAQRCRFLTTFSISIDRHVAFGKATRFYSFLGLISQHSACIGAINLHFILSSG